MSGSPPVSPGKVPTLATLEREGELEVLERALVGVADGAGAMVVVEGPIGIGKSRLLDEAHALAERRRLTVLSARGGELERGYPFGVVLQLFEQPMAALPPQAHEQVLQGRAAMAEQLLSGTRDEDASTSPADEFALLHALYWLVVNLAERQPLALIVDDVHWADDLSLRFLLYLAERITDLPVVLVTAVRSSSGPRDGGELVDRLVDATELPRLRPTELSLGATRRLLADAGLRAAEDDDAVRACRKATGGTPLLLRELIVALRRDPEHATTIDPLVIESLAPRSLESRIVPRITSIGPDAISLARGVALLGDDARLADAASIADVPFDGAVRLAEDLLDASIFGDLDPPRFAHPMVRSILYASIPPGEQRRLHARAASVLHARGAPPERVARHLRDGSPVAEPWAADCLHAAARAAANRGAPAIAVEYLRDAVERLGSGEARASMLVDLGLLEAATGRTASLERFEAALEVLESEEEQARALYALGQTLYRYGRHDEAITTWRRGAERFVSDRETSLAFEAAAACAGTWIVAAAEGARSRLAELARAIPGDREPTVAERALLGALAAFSAGCAPPASSGAALAREALGNAELLRAQGPQSVPIFLSIYALVSTGQSTEAERQIDLVVDEARRRDDSLAFAEASMVRSQLMYLTGRIGEAVADAEATLEGVASGWRVAPQVARATLALCRLERGEIDAAEALLADSDLETTSGMGPDALMLEARARVRLLRGDAKGALDLCWAERDALAPGGITNPTFARWRPVACAALRELDDLEAARAVIEEELALGREWGLSGIVGAALRERATLDPGDAGLADLRASLEALDPESAPLERARSLLDLGLRLHAGGDVMEARDALRDALGLAHTSGATALEERAREALVAAGGRPRRAATAGVEALTPSERRIADLVAAGKTNRAIAEALFLTKYTVEWHLRNIFKKLGITSRAQLRALLDDGS